VKAKKFISTFIAAQCWALWITRNKFTIEKKFPRQPTESIFKIILSLQLWHPLQRTKDMTALDELVSMTKAFFASTYSHPVTTPSL
jgi:hypothetical protein